MNGLYWHVHHDKLFEWCYDYEGRLDFIKNNKPEGEIELRLKLFQPIKGKVPKEIIEAWQKHDEAWQKYHEARQKYHEYMKSLHENECPNCPWDGKTIFPKG